MDRDKTIQWGTSVIPGLVDVGLDPAFGAMLERNVRSPSAKVSMAAAVELAEMIRDLPPAQRASVESLASHIEGVSVDGFFASSRSEIKSLLKRNSVENEDDFRVLEEALNNGVLTSKEAEKARLILRKHLVSIQDGK